MPAPTLTVIFDEDCGVCSASVEWLRRRDSRVRMRFVGNLGALPAEVQPEETQETVVVLEDGGRKLVRAEAVGRLLRELGFCWRLLGHLLRLPGLGWLADACYRAFAQRRHRVSAALGLGVCDLRPPHTTGPARSRP